jgi:hypothetical protein
MVYFAKPSSVAIPLSPTPPAAKWPRLKSNPLFKNKEVTEAEAMRRYTEYKKRWNTVAPLKARSEVQFPACLSMTASRQAAR